MAVISIHRWLCSAGCLLLATGCSPDQGSSGGTSSVGGGSSSSSESGSSNGGSGSAGGATSSSGAGGSNGATSSSGAGGSNGGGNLAKHALVGYWHNFNNPSGCAIPLSQVSDDWDVIVVAFAENDPLSNGTLHFTPYAGGDPHSPGCAAIEASQFKADVKAKRAAGKIVALSLGGAEGNITLNTDSDEASFVSSLTGILSEWGFDGIDVDLESGSGLTHGSQIQTRLVSAIK
jgi:chitinase